MSDSQSNEPIIPLTASGTERRSEVLDRPTHFSAQPAATLNSRGQIGLVLGRFQLEMQIGRGGMGEVWKAFDPLLSSTVVIKLLPVELAANVGEIHRLKESCLRVRALPHPSICPVYHFENDPEYGPYLVMKYIEGVSLSVYRHEYVQQHGPFGVAEVVRVLRPIAEALDYAHGKGVIHRDIKPDNILVQPDGSDPQLVDFGLAAEIQRSMTRASQTRFDTSGTLAYMAPEQLRGRPQDGRTDQYALTALSFELLTGQPPYDLPNSDLLVRCVLQEPPPELPIAVGNTNLSGVLIRGLAKDPMERFPNCVALIQAVEKPPKRVAASPSETKNGPATAGSSLRWMALVALLAAVLVGVGFWLRNMTETPAAVASASPPSATVSPPVVPTPTPVSNPAPVVPTPTPTPAPQPTPLPAPPPDALSAAEQDQVIRALEVDLDKLAGPVKGWRDKLTAIDAPADTTRCCRGVQTFARNAKRTRGVRREVRRREHGVSHQSAADTFGCDGIATKAHRR